MPSAFIFIASAVSFITTAITFIATAITFIATAERKRKATEKYLLKYNYINNRAIA